MRIATYTRISTDEDHQPVGDGAFRHGLAAGRMMVQMLGVFVEFERATIVERVIAGMERKAARGEWAAGRVPYGCRRDERLQFLTPDAAELPVVRIIFERYADRLEGSQSIARWLTGWIGEASGRRRARRGSAARGRTGSGRVGRRSARR
jgi:DNA invertase Pin-like site-specific DNA recombinase